MDFTRKNSATSTQCSSCGGATWGSASQASGGASSQNGQTQTGTHQPSSSCICALPWRSDAGAGSSGRDGPRSSNSTRAGYSSGTGSARASSGGGEWGSATSNGYDRNTPPPSSATDGMDYRLQGSSDAHSQRSSTSYTAYSQYSLTGYEAQAQYPPADYWCPRSSAGAQGAPVSPQLERFQSSTSRYDNPSVWMGGGYSGLDPSQQMLDMGGGSLGPSHVETHLEEINQRLPRSCQPGSSALTRRNR
ncbi:hypothetical protein RB596_008178 [Gaeumannomyces avenae]